MSSKSSSSLYQEELKQKVSQFPTTPGVYLMKNESEKIIYVGKAKNLKKRVQSYFQKKHEDSLKTQFLVGRIHSIDYLLTQTEVEAFLLEATLIKKHKPRYNIRLKDDKNYPYIRCNIRHEYPRFDLVRKVKRDGDLYFGPYTSSFAVRETIQFIHQYFKLRDCSDAEIYSRKRACMNYQIDRCTAPCMKFISVEDYQKDVQMALEFVRGQSPKVLKQLEVKMKQLAGEEKFEKAAKYRDSLSAIKKIWEKQEVVSTDLHQDQDVVALFGDDRGTLFETLHIRSGRVIGHRNYFFKKLKLHSVEEGELKEQVISFLNQYYSENVLPNELILPIDLGADLLKLLKAVFRECYGKQVQVFHVESGESHALMNMAKQNAENHFISHVERLESHELALKEIQKKLHLSQTPYRIECFDISHFQGSETVASQVVFEEGVPKREDYRRYLLKSQVGVNDYDSMKEVLQRRLKHTEYEDPQLIVIDGGKGQLNIVCKVLEEMGRSDLKVVGLAKSRTQSSFQKAKVDKTEERFFLPGRQNPVVFKEGSLSFQILVQIRDEAHRFAVTYHQLRQNKKSLESELDVIKGLGTRRKVILLKKFRSVEGIRKAQLEEIAELPTFSMSLAEKIKEQL